MLDKAEIHITQINQGALYQSGRILWYPKAWSGWIRRRWITAQHAAHQIVSLGVIFRHPTLEKLFKTEIRFKSQMCNSVGGHAFEKSEQ